MQRLFPLWTLFIAFTSGVLACVVYQLLAPSTKSASAELAQSKSFQDTGEIQNAYDALLAAMRVAPGDEKVFDASLEFARKVGMESNEEAVGLAQDIHQRAANLIPFLPLKRLKQARAEHNQAEDDLFGRKKATATENPLAEVEHLLTAAKRADLPTAARVRLLHEVEAELNSQARRATSTTMNKEDEKKFWADWESVKGKHDAAQSEILKILFVQDCKPKVDQWIKKVNECIIEMDSQEDFEKIRTADKERFLPLIKESQVIARTMSVYVEGGVPDAININPTYENTLATLAQHREWCLNRWTLAHVDRIEASEMPKLDRLKELARVEEHRLSSFVAQRFTEVWKKIFDTCTPDEKIEATKHRILREYQP